jgi:hypothetical protein
MPAGGFTRIRMLDKTFVLVAGNPFRLPSVIGRLRSVRP